MVRHEKQSHKGWLLRGTSVFLCGILVFSGVTCGVAASGANPSPTCDEAYYATLDYYGNLQSGSVVKSYCTNGAASLVDYGTYDDVVNLTDGLEPVQADNTVEFDFADSSPNRFYFEGKTEEPFAKLPWTLSVSYRLNGVQVSAEDLAGQTGLVEINIDAVPNAGASEYAQNNFVLEAASLFNADDIVSLEAPGAQIQLIGNLRMVLFMALPGQEEHFTIRVGANDFAFDGLTFMMEPATLMQLDQLSTLRDAKDDIENSYQDINTSLDAILNALDGMSGSLNATADGLDQLDAARAQIAAGKGSVYKSADGALNDLTGISDAMQPIGGYLDSASQALTKTTGLLTQLTSNATALKEQLTKTQTAITSIQKDVENLQTLSTDLEAYNASGRTEVKNLRGDLDTLQSNAVSLRNTLAALQTTMTAIQSAPLSSINKITIGGMSVEEFESVLNSAAQIGAAYQKAVAAGSQATYEQFAYGVLLQKAGITDPSQAPAEVLSQLKTQAAGLNQIWTMSQQSDLVSQINQAKTINSMLGSAADSGTVNGTLAQVNAMLTALLKPTVAMTAQLQTLCDNLGEDGLSGDADDVLVTLNNILTKLDEHAGEVGNLLGDLNNAGTILSNITKNAGNAIDLAAKLDDTVNEYVPTAQSALQDAKKLSDSAASGMRNVKTFLQTLEGLMKSSGQTLDAGTQQTLQGLAAALRQSTTGLSETDSIRDAKKIITDRIDDEWNTYAGDDNNLLMIDPNAPMVSLTSAENPAPTSVQILMRTQEIKADDSTVSTVSTSSAATANTSGGFWGRVGQMFHDLWHALTGWMH